MEAGPQALTSAPPAPFGSDEPAVGEGPLLVVYLDLACPVCAATWARLRVLGLRLGIRHFPLAARRPRSPALHAAVEAAGLQASAAAGRIADLILVDQSRIDDPHLWERAERLGLDVDRFEADRRSAAAADRVRAGFLAALRGGVTAAPSALGVAGPVTGRGIEAAAKSLLASGESVAERGSGRVNIAR
ncbi:hypothetical protein HJD18_07780 [Thermoleophilia bacterium SCSIO 60948]|nr:hypothetical protein HJD18_07780 [Thermoleophilia bacterium SCSIO 60948]